MSAPYRIDGGVLHISGLSTTEMGCDAALHAQDDWFANLLWSSPTIALNEPELTLQSTNVSITFLDRELASPDLPLVGTQWVLNAVGDGQTVGSGIGYDQATLSFDDAGNVSVFTACQTGTGRYAADASTITFEGLSYDGASCSDPLLDRVSQTVVSVLDGSPVTYSIEERTLSIERGVNALYFAAGT
jgi:heat shock protein HslJ